MLCVCTAAPCHAQPSGDGYDWVTVRDAGNAPYDRVDRSPFQRVTGRGSVNYEYRMGRTEVTTAQWVEFLNALYGRADQIEFSFPV